MSSRTCPRNSGVSHGRAPLDLGLRAHLDRCEECRETWVVASAIRTLADESSGDPHPDTSVDRILLLARLELSRRRDRIHRRVVSCGVVLVVAIWIVLAGSAARPMSQESAARGITLALAAMATTLALSRERSFEVRRW